MQFGIVQLSFMKEDKKQIWITVICLGDQNVQMKFIPKLKSPELYGNEDKWRSQSWW